MATKNQNDMVCVRCGCEISIVEEPSRGYVRGTTYCPICKDPMTQRLYLKKMITVDNICEKFGMQQTYSVRASIKEKMYAAEKMFRNGYCKKAGKIGDTDVYTVISEDKQKSYVVTVREGFYNCNCPDQLFRHHVCKHIITVMFHREREGINPFK